MFWCLQLWVEKTPHWMWNGFLWTPITFLSTDGNEGHICGHFCWFTSYAVCVCPCARAGVWTWAFASSRREGCIHGSTAGGPTQVEMLRTATEYPRETGRDWVRVWQIKKDSEEGGEGEKKKVFSPGERGEIVGPWKEGMREEEKEGARRDSGPKQAEFSWGWKDEKGRDSDREKGELLCHSEEELSSVWPFQTNSHPFIQSLLNLTHVQKKKIIKIPPWTLLSFISCFPALFSHKYGLGTGPHLLCSYSALSQVIERWFCNYSLFFCQMMTA